MRASSEFNSVSVLRTFGPPVIAGLIYLAGITNPVILGTALLALYAMAYAPKLLSSAFSSAPRYA